MTVRKRLSLKLGKRSGLTVAIRQILGSGCDFSGELDNLIDVAGIKAELIRLRKDWQANRDAIIELDAKLSGNLWNADASDARVVFLREQWQRHAAEVLAYHIAKFPGERPWAFWYFDRPGERPPGVSSCSQEGRLRELEFLIRHDLLSAEEERAIHAADDFRAKALDGAGAIDEETK